MPCRRILLAQDRHEIFVVVASFGPAYVDYIRQPAADPTDSISPLPSSSTKPMPAKPKSSKRNPHKPKIPKLTDVDFLRMHEFGPFDVTKSNDMQIVGIILLRIADMYEETPPAGPTGPDAS